MNQPKPAPDTEQILYQALSNLVMAVRDVSSPAGSTVEDLLAQPLDQARAALSTYLTPVKS